MLLIIILEDKPNVPDYLMYLKYKPIKSSRSPIYEYYNEGGEIHTHVNPKGILSVSVTRSSN